MLGGLLSGILLLGAVGPGSGAEAAPRAIVAQFGFDSDSERAAVRAQPAAALEAGQDGATALRISVPTTGGAMVRLPLDVERLRGTTVEVSALAKADGVSKPPQVWSGIKLMLHTDGPSGQTWANQNDLYGTFDWKLIGCRTAVPADATEAWLMLGLEQTDGTVWFQQPTVRLARPARQRPAQPAAAGQPVFTGHPGTERLRGVMISPRIGADDLRHLATNWKANLVRWQLHWSQVNYGDADGRDMAAYDRFLAEQTANLDALLPLCAELGLYVLIDLHTPPGGMAPGNAGHYVFQEPALQEKFFAVWEGLVRRYRDQPAVWGYDLFNEPVEGLVGPDCLDWPDLAQACAERIRALDPKRAIIVEPASWGNAEGFDQFEPLTVPGVVYSFHFYGPHRYTHQGVSGNPAGLTYPGEIGDHYWDKAALEEAMRPAIEFQRDYGVALYVGEFSAARWAPGGRQWLDDVVSIFEQHGWDWSYHAYREWNGWSLEHGPDPDNHQATADPAQRAPVLMAAMASNERPVLEGN